MHGHRIVDIPPHQLLDDLDHLALAAAQAGQFADDQTIPRYQRVQQFGAVLLVPPLAGGGLHFDESDNGTMLLPANITSGPTTGGRSAPEFFRLQKICIAR